MATATLLPPEQLSRLIGMIYDCAVDSRIWPEALHEVSGLVDGVAASIFIHDVTAGRVRFNATWGGDADWMRLYRDHYAAQNPLIMAAYRYEDAEPVSIAKLVDLEAFTQSPLYREWCQPQGFCDVLGSILMRREARAAVLAIARHERDGIATPGDLEMLRLLTPHMRRAILIGDLIDLKTLSGAVLSEVLDTVTVAVVVVGAGGNLLHANRAASRMLGASRPIRMAGSGVTATDREAGRRLAAAIAEATANETHIGALGLGVTLPDEERPSIAYVLPLAGSELRSRLAPAAAAAIFVTRPAVGTPSHVEAFAAAYDLTPAETRVLERLTMGETLAEAAGALAIAETTAKTHLARIFAKTGVVRQAELARLVDSMIPPVSPVATGAVRPAGQ